MPLTTASAAGARVVFSASAPDADGLFTVSVTAYDAKFDAFQFSINYDSGVVTPASWSTGAATREFKSFAKAGTDADKLDVYGYAPNDKDLINYAGIAYPEDVSQVSPDDFYVSAGSGGALIVTFRFKLLHEGDTGIALATSGTGKAYNNSVPNGLTISKAGVSFGVDVSFKFTSGLSGSDTTSSVISKEERARNTIILQIGNYAAAKDGALCHIYPGEKQVTPYIQGDGSGNGRTMVPLRFVAETLGASVSWIGSAKPITITLGGNTVVMTVGSTAYTVNGAAKIMDAAPEMKDIGDGSGNGRVMVPMRFVIEALGKDVYWDNTNSLVVVTEPEVPWQADRNAEQELTSDVLLVISPLLRDLIK
jgi:hypothetical protein